MRLYLLVLSSVSSVFSVGTLLALVVALLTAPLGAQTAKSRSQLYTDIDTNLPSTTGAITAAVLRTQLKNVVASAYNVVVADAQPLDSDLTAIAALTTTSFGRGLLTETSAATLKTTLALNLVANTADADKPVSTAQATAIAAAQAASQPLDADLTAIAGLATTAFGRSFLPLVDAAAGRTLLGLGTLATQSGTFSGTSSGTNTGDNAVNSLYSGLVSNATHTGDATGSGALTLATVNANVGGFGSATAAPTFTVNAKGLITAAGSATITPAVGSITGLGTGIATALAINTGNSGAPVLIDGALGTPTSGVAVNLTALNATQLTSGTVPDARFPATLPAASGVNLTALNASNLGSGTVPAARFPALTGEATTSAGAVSVTLTNSAVIGKVLTGYTSGAGTVAATDTILQAIQKLNGNAANLQPLDAELTAISGLAANGLIARTSASTAAARTLTGTAAEITVTNGDGVAGNPTLSLPAALTFTGKTVTGGTFTSPALTTPTIGDGSAAVPSLSFASETTTGLFRPSANVLGLAVAGTSRATVTTTGLTVTGTVTPTGSVHAPNGTVGNPSLSFNNDQDSGLYHIGANNLGLALGGAKVLDVATTGLGVTGGLSATGQLTVASNSLIGSASPASDITTVQLFQGSNVARNWRLAANVAGGEFTITPSTAGGGTTYTTPILTVATTGVAVTGRVEFAGAPAFAAGSIYLNATNGLVIGGKTGSSADFLLTNNSGNTVLTNPTGTVNLTTGGNLVVTGTSSSTGSTVAVTTAGTGGAAFRAGFAGSVQAGMDLSDSTDSSNAAFVVFRNSAATAIGSINRVTTTNAVSYNTTSDARLKTNIRDFTAADAARIIDGLRPRWFDWKSGDLTESVEETVDTGKKDKEGKAITEKRQKNQKVKDAARTAQHIADNKSIIGFIAQEEAAVDPALVRAGAVTVGDDDPTTISRQWARSDAALVPVLVAELKSLRARVAELEKENASLDARMAAVEALLKK